jgi:transcriptional regulator with XRE-family HTH domain
VKVSGPGKRVIAERVERGESQAQIAADLGISQASVSTIANKERKQAEAKKQRAKAARAIEGDCGVVEGDFRTFGSVVADASVDLIFTDPPYLEEDMPIYGDLVPADGYWLIAGTLTCRSL